MQTEKITLLRDLIARSELSLALEQLASLTRGGPFTRATAQLQSRYAHYQQELMAGTRDAEESTRARNAIVESFLTLLERIRAGKPAEEEAGDAAAPTVSGKNIIVGNVSHVRDIRIGDNTEK